MALKPVQLLEEPAEEALEERYEESFKEPYEEEEKPEDAEAATTVHVLSFLWGETHTPEVNFLWVAKA